MLERIHERILKKQSVVAKAGLEELADQASEISSV